jgi:DNA-binding CsgD family transcriptional regulator/tetratricopeptide (TPR) repeat protein
MSPMLTLRQDALIGRHPERSVLVDALDASRNGSGNMVVLLGEAGLGKSRLCRDLEAAAAEEGQPILKGRAVQSGPPEPFRPLIEALATGFRESGPPDDPSLLPHRAVLSHLVPGWSRKQTPIPTVIALAEALLRLLAVTAHDRGALVLLEDLHWADEDLLSVVEYLADNALAHGACCVVTLRTDPDGPALALARRLADRRAVTLIELTRLANPDVDELVRHHLHADALPDELLSFVRDRADGVPFFVEELLLGLVRRGAIVAGPHGWQLVATRMAATVPSTLGDWVGDRYRSLTPRTQAVVAAAALLGQPFDWTLLPTITSLDESTVLASLREASYAQLIQDEEGSLRFRHALTREHVRASILAPERTQLAGQVHGVVTSAQPELPGHWCDLAAELAELAGHPSTAATHLLVSATRAQQRGALSTALARLDQAVELLPNADPQTVTALRRRAEVRALAGDVDGALDDAARATDAGPALTAQDRVDLDLALGRALLAARRTDDAHRLADRARDVGHQLGDQDRVAQATLLAAGVAIERHDIPVAAQLAAMVDQHDGLDPALACEALELLGRCARLHDVAEAEDRFGRALAIARRHDLALWEARALHELGTIDLLDRMRTDRLEAARRAGIEAGAPSIAAVADLHLAAVLVSRGETVAAREAAQRAEVLATRLGHAVAPWATMLIGRTHAHERRRDDAEAAIRRALSGPSDPSLESQAHGHVRAWLALHLADQDEARSELDAAMTLLRQVPGHHDPHWGLWALLRTLAGDDDRAARQEAAAAAGSDTRYNRAMLALAEAVATGRAGRFEDAADHHRRGMGTLTAYSGADLLAHLATWLTAPAALADGWGDPVPSLQHAVRWFAEHGHDPLAASCRTLLRDVGGVVPRRGRGSSVVPANLKPAGVTSREADVLFLVAEGLTNAEIAARLVLSPRTVEKHVAALLRKTRSANRGDLARLVTST